MTRPQDAARRPVRLWLREATHRLHLDLHEHPLYRRLTEPDLTYQELRATAAVTYAAASAVEADRARRQLWPEISLSDHLTALERDLGDEPGPAPQSGLACLTSDAGLLGALYVIHGSAFGAAALAKTIWRAVPSAPRSFVVPRDLGAWRSLCQLLDAVPEADLPVLAEAAQDVFRTYKRLADLQLAGLQATLPPDAVRTIPPARGPAWQAASR
ncbi:heme oxygenase, putative [Rhodobacterales bacterium Y4I]|nr:heme oxygenase, putative [Rhodobacterales bacterium Y4I]